MFFFLQRFKCTDGHNYVFFICTISMVVHSLKVQKEKDTPCSLKQFLPYKRKCTSHAVRENALLLQK